MHCGFIKKPENKMERNDRKRHVIKLLNELLSEIILIVRRDVIGNV